MDHNTGAYGIVEVRGAVSGLPPARPASSAPRVLVVDDNAVNRKLAVLLLAKSGMQADTSSDGLEALQAIERVPYVLVLMDCHMPGMDGLAATRELRRLEAGRQRLPVIAMTASVGDDIKSCLDAGMDGELPKPASRAALENVLRTWAAPVSPEAVRRVEQILDGDAKAFAQLLQEFIRSGSALADMISSASAAADRGALSLAAHAMKGSCLNFGARPLAYICARLESMAEAGQALSCRPFADAAAEEFERVREALEAWDASPFRVS